MAPSVRFAAVGLALLSALAAVVPESSGPQEGSLPAPSAPQGTPAAPPPGLLPLELVAELEPASRPILPLLFRESSLIVVSRNGTVEAFTAETGERRWEAHPFQGLDEPYLPPVAWDDQVLISSANGKLVWIDTDSGAIAGEAHAPCPLAVSPVRDLDALYFASSAGCIVATRATRDGVGEELWRADIGLEPRALARGGDVLLVSGGNGGLVALRAANGVEMWRFHGRGAFDVPAVFDGRAERVFVGDRAGIFYALDADDGEQRYAWSTGAAIEAPALVEGDRVYVVSYANTLFAYRASTGDELWRAALPGRPASPPVRVQNRLVVATLTGVLVQLDPVQGRLDKASYRAPRDVLAPPSFRETLAALTLRAGTILLLKKQTQPPPEAPVEEPLPDGGEADSEDNVLPPDPGDFPPVVPPAA